VGPFLLLLFRQAQDLPKTFADMLHEAGTVTNQSTFNRVDQRTSLFVEAVTAASGSYEIGPLGLVFNDEFDGDVRTVFLKVFAKELALHKTQKLKVILGGVLQRGRAGLIYLRQRRLPFSKSMLIKL